MTELIEWPSLLATVAWWLTCWGVGIAGGIFVGTVRRGISSF